MYGVILTDAGVVPAEFWYPKNTPADTKAKTPAPTSEPKKAESSVPRTNGNSATHIREGYCEYCWDEPIVEEIPMPSGHKTKVCSECRVYIGRLMEGY